MTLILLYASELNTRAATPATPIIPEPSSVIKLTLSTLEIPRIKW